MNLNLLMFFLAAILFNVATSASFNFKTDDENLDEASKDISAFDKILTINQKAAKSGHVPKMFEGDIVETELLKEMNENRKRGAASSIKQHIWPIVNGKHEIPFHLSEGLQWRYKNTILGAIKEWTDKVPCLRFVEISNLYLGGYIDFESESGCFSYVGRQGSRQPINLAPGCIHHGMILHEIGHALGFFHEQSRKDRDTYLTIHWENIELKYRRNFNISSTTDDTAFPDYDYKSIMQFGPKAYTANGLDTITAKNGRDIGQRLELSAGDVQQAKKLYTACGGGGSGAGTTEKPGCLTDNHVGCKIWSGRGYCRHSYVQYMLRNCKKSCCSGNLTNNNVRCQKWANLGYCFVFPGYMLKNCLASCCRC